jgi:hypothetical protein
MAHRKTLGGGETEHFVSAHRIFDKDGKMTDLFMRLDTAFSPEALVVTLEQMCNEIKNKNRTI